LLLFQPVNLIFCITPESAGTMDRVNRPEDGLCNHRAISIIGATFENKVTYTVNTDKKKKTLLHDGAL